MQSRAISRTMKRIRTYLEEHGEATVYELAQVIHLSVRNTRDYLYLLHHAHVVHIGRYLPNRINVYAIGPGDDAPRPGRQRRSVKRQLKPKTKDVPYNSLAGKSVLAAVVGAWITR